MRVLFVCLGNSCRSQMAEGFARSLGAGLWEVDSAGLSPATWISSPTRYVMAEKRIVLDDHFPKGLEEVRLDDYDLVVNMSGFDLPPEVKAPELRWDVLDPIGGPEKTYRKVRDQIEELVRGLLEEVRTGVRGFRQGSGRI